MEYYWQIETWDKEIIKVKPDQAKIAYIQELFAKGEGVITTPVRSINIKSIKDFSQSDERYIDQQLLEASNTAFNEATINPDGSVKSRYVKKSVPQRMWDKFYKYNPAYRVLEMSDNHVIVAFILPTHVIDNERVQELTPDDERRLSKITA